MLVAETIWHLHSKGVVAFIQETKVGVSCGNDDKIS